MVVIKEYRIVMPLSLEEYRVGQVYMTANTQLLEAQQADGAGVDLVENKEMEFDDLGKGIYTKKIYWIDKRFPPWLRMIAPKSGSALHEEAKNCFPVTKTRLTLPMFKNFSISVDTIHAADRGTQDNVHKLPLDVLKKREVVMVDICKPEKKEEGEKRMFDKDTGDPTTFVSKKTGRGPLRPGWQQKVVPVMCAYKLVTAEFDYLLMQSKVEEFMHSYELGLFGSANRQMWCAVDEWFGLSFQDVRRFESRVAERTTMITNLKKENKEVPTNLPEIKPEISDAPIKSTSVPSSHGPGVIGPAPSEPRTLTVGEAPSQAVKAAHESDSNTNAAKAANGSGSQVTNAEDKPHSVSMDGTPASSTAGFVRDKQHSHKGASLDTSLEGLIPRPPEAYNKPEPVPVRESTPQHSIRMTSSFSIPPRTRPPSALIIPVQGSSSLEPPPSQKVSFDAAPLESSQNIIQPPPRRARQPGGLPAGEDVKIGQGARPPQGRFPLPRHHGTPPVINRATNYPADRSSISIEEGKQAIQKLEAAKMELFLSATMPMSVHDVPHCEAPKSSTLSEMPPSHAFVAARPPSDHWAAVPVNSLHEHGASPAGHVHVKRWPSEQRMPKEGEARCSRDGCGMYGQYMVASSGLRVCSIECRKALRSLGSSHSHGLHGGWEESVDTFGRRFFVNHTLERTSTEVTITSSDLIVPCAMHTHSSAAGCSVVLEGL